MIARRRGWSRLVGVAAAVVALSGCAGMPTEGPVVESEVSADKDQVPGIYFDPLPPQPDASTTEIVTGFLEAMQATPIKTTVAQQFLTAEARESWAPEERILTYTELGDPSGELSVSLPLKDVNAYDERGAWSRSTTETTLTFGLAKENGEWRIDEAPNALVVPETWFESWYERVSLYFFDPTGEILVPEPVFVPKGDQFASALVRGLLTQTAEPQVSRTFFPEGMTHGLSVPISTAGIAEVALTGDPDQIDEQTAHRMKTQLVWTLRQEPRIKAVQLTIDGREVGTPGPTQVGLDVGGAADPNGGQSTGDLFALLDGLLVRGSIQSMLPVPGPLGQTPYGVRSVAVNLPGARAAAVTSGGTGVLIAPVEQPDGAVEQVFPGATDLLPPAWDFGDRVWLVDRAANGARVLLLVDGQARELRVDGITGRRVERMMVSRDGSRLVAVVRGAASDKVVVSRILHSDAGRVLRLTRARPLSLGSGAAPRVRDIGWRSPTTLSILRDITNGSEVRTVSVDGAEGEITTEGTTRLRGRTRQLVSSPLEGGDVFAIAGRAVTDITQPDLELEVLPKGLTSLTFAG